MLLILLGQVNCSWYATFSYLLHYSREATRSLRWQCGLNLYERSEVFSFNTTEKRCHAHNTYSLQNTNIVRINISLLLRERIQNVLQSKARLIRHIRNT